MPSHVTPWTAARQAPLSMFNSPVSSAQEPEVAGALAIGGGWGKHLPLQKPRPSDYVWETLTNRACGQSDQQRAPFTADGRLQLLPGNIRRSCQMKRKLGAQPAWTHRQVQRDDTRATRTIAAACWTARRAEIIDRIWMSPQNSHVET